ncbi:MAG: PAS domain S-box protein [Deltaproteobacteria bacterium]|nr:PAS domain S-box protein [Deltaproteobacteria bacterium]
MSKKDHSNTSKSGEGHKKKHTISRDLVISLVSVVVAVSCLLIYLNYWIISRNAQRELQQKTDDYLSYLVDSLELPIWNFDEESIGKIAQSYFSNEIIAKLVITDPGGRVLFDRFYENENALVTRSGWVLHDGKVIGHVELGLTSRFYRQNNNRLLWSSILTMLVVILSIIGMTRFLFRILLKNPLDYLIKGIDRLAGGDYEYRFPEVKQLEIDAIISRFNIMAERIKGRERSLTEMNKRLEDEIVQRKATEAALRDSEAKYRNILESMEEGYFEVDLAGNLTFFNDSVCRISGYTRDELMGMNNRIFSRPEASKKMYMVFREVYETGMPTKMTEQEIIRKDGRMGILEMSVSLIRDSIKNPVGFRGVVRDVTERKIAGEERMRLESRLQHAQRMEAIGTLAGGIAHDFNNLLMGIQGNVSLALLNTDVNSPDYEKLKHIEEYVQTGADVTKQLLGLAKGGKYEVKPSDINALIKQGSEMFGRTRKEIQINSKFQEDVWTLEIDQGQIGQAMLNLYVNAWQAMPAGGDLFLETQNVVLREDFVKPFGVPPGKYVKISVVDNGSGMDEEIKKKIFDPFFTTRKMGRGTGLGLASVYGIVRNHGGIITVNSEKDAGTAFELYLPASEKMPEQQKTSTKKMVGGSETILFIDDEEMIVDVGIQMLKALGYKVFSARSGTEGVEIYKKNKNEIDLVILDMIMPEMGGGKTYDLLKHEAPGVKVILSSGYSLDGQAGEILNKGCNGFIQKPFDMKDLSRKLREVLDKN